MAGPQPSQADVQALVEIGETPINPAEHPNLFALWALASKFSPAVRNKWPAADAQAAPQKGGKGPAAKKEAPKAAAKEEDDFDPFADEMDDEEKAQMERMKEKAAAANKKVKTVIAKSLVIFEVKPWGEDTDLDELAKLILGIEQDGLEWKTEYKKEPVAYGVFKLVIGAVIEDDKVSTDDLEEKIVAFEDHC